ncbi:MAG: hypothetical protein EG822_16310 [Deltaproteobacteria bacterium]|nr:hypothetical protein [Deltaproteobacteria bacterium]TLN01376.1 MAG: hypothetical protein FDZ73_16045 [bacterium]
MSKFFSNSSGKRHYARHNYGSDYYKRSHRAPSGILGWILGLLFSSRRRHSSSHSPDHDYHAKRSYRPRHKSWS